MSIFDTSKEAYEQIGIKLTEEQYELLARINAKWVTDESPQVPVHFLLMILKALKIIGNDEVRSYCGKNGCNDCENICEHLDEHLFGIVKRK